MVSNKPNAVFHPVVIIQSSSPSKHHSHEHLGQANRAPNPTHRIPEIKPPLRLHRLPLKCHPAPAPPTHLLLARQGAEHPLDAGREPEPELGQQGGEGAAGDERHDDQDEDLDGVALHVADEGAEEAAELLVHALEEGGARGALVVRGGGGAGTAEACGWVSWLVEEGELVGWEERSGAGRVGKVEWIRTTEEA